MRLRLISFAICPYVHRTRILLDQKGVAYDTDYIDLDQKPSWFLDRVPTGKVPALFVGNETLFESNVINEYLDDTTAPALLPTEPLTRAREKAWIAYSDGLLLSLFRALKAESSPEYEEHKTALLNGIAGIEDFVTTRMRDGFRLGAFEIAVAPSLFRIAQVPDLWDALWSRIDESSTLGRWSRYLVEHTAVTNSVPADFVARFTEFLDLTAQGNSRSVQGNRRHGVAS